MKEKESKGKKKSKKLAVTDFFKSCFLPHNFPKFYSETNIHPCIGIGSMRNPPYGCGVQWCPSVIGFGIYPMHPSGFVDFVPF